MVKIKGRKYRRTKMTRDGKCRKGSSRHVRGKSKRAGCYELVKGKK